MQQVPQTDTLGIIDQVKDSVTFGLAHLPPKPLMGENMLHTLLQAAPRPVQYDLVPGWYFILLFLLLAGYAMSRRFFGQLLHSTFNGAIRYNTTVSMFRDNSLVQRQKDNILYAVYFLSGGFYALIMETRYALFPFGLQGFRLYIWNVAFLAVFFYLRIFVMTLVGHLFNRRELFREYLYHSFAYNKLMGIILVPVSFIIVYTGGVFHEITVYFSFAVILLMIVMKISRGVIFSLKRVVFKFYLFLYLCALEIVPILLLYKWISTIV